MITGRKKYKRKYSHNPRDRVLWIKELTAKRYELGLSLRQCGRACSLHNSTISNWETFRTLGTFALMKRYAIFLSRYEAGEVNILNQEV